MEGEVITKAGGLLTFGFLFIYLGARGWKDRRDERISLIEAAALKAADEEPLALSAWDRAMAYAAPILMLVFGPCMILLGLGLLIS